jgi:alanine racemase
MRIGVLPLGYYEGVPRELGNKGVVTVGGDVLPIVGPVCMNHTMIDLKGTDLAVGDRVTVVSNDPTSPNSIRQISTTHNLFSYSLMTGLSNTTRRIIV